MRKKRKPGPRKTDWKKGSKAPHPTKGKRKAPTIQTDDARAIILQTLSMGSSVGLASEKAGISRFAYYKWCNQDKEFAAEVKAAIDRGSDRFEDAARGRAIDGVDKALVSGGEIIGYEKNYSDGLMMFMLKARRPETYRDNATIDLNQNVSFVGAAERLASRLTEIFKREETADKDDKG